MATLTDSTHKTSAEAPDKGVGSSDLFGLLRTANRLTEIHSTVTRFCGDKWPTYRDEWQAIIRSKAAKENKQELAAAIELAKGSPEPMQSLVILAAAYEL